MKFVVVDISNTILHADLAKYAAAQQRQLREHYASCYDGDGCRDSVRVSRSHIVPPDEVPINLHPSAPSSGGDALGIHDTLRGVPVIDVYLDLAQQSGDPWQGIASHEVLEARTDPRLHACIELDDGSIWDREICDRVEADAYTIDAVPMSNFNTPQCFEPGSPGHGLEIYDWLKLSTRPNEVRPGGYAQKFDPNRGWTQVGEMRPYRAQLAKRLLSRGVRRRARRGFSIVEVKGNPA